MLRLAGLFAAVGLATSRVGLIVHELAGHGGTALAFGGQVSDFRLFWFAGGWIRYDLDEPSRGVLIAISIGGVVLEAVIGLALWLVLRRKDSLAARLARGVGAALLIHAGWYFATGTWHGYGDGLLVHRAVGDWRYPIAIAAGIVTCLIAYAGARLVLGSLAASLPGARGARVAGVLVAAVLAGALQVGLAVGEVRVRGDSTYGAIMKPERERVIARELLAWQRAQAQRGTQISEADRAAQARSLAARHTEPPFAPVLALSLAVAVALGARRTRAATEAVTTRLVAIAAAIAAGSIVAVIALDAAFH